MFLDCIIIWDGWHVDDTPRLMNNSHQNYGYERETGWLSVEGDI